MAKFNIDLTKEYVCDEVKNVILYWNKATMEFWGKAIDVGLLPTPTEKAVGWLKSFMTSDTVREYVPEPKPEVNHRALEVRLEFLERRIFALEKKGHRRKPRK